MKRNYLMIGALTGTMLLAGCSLSDFGLGNGASDDNNKSSQTDKSNKDSNSKSDNSTNNKKNNDANSENSVKDLNQAEKVALALSDDSVSNVAITANDLKRHSYSENGNAGKTQKSIDKYELQATGEAVEDAPEGMTFYSASPARGPFATLIGVSDDKVAVIGTQSPGKYRQFIQSDLGHELDVKDLYHKYGKDSDYKKVAKQISISGGSNSAHSANSNDKNTKEYFAKIWLTARNDADDIFYEEDHTYEPVDMSGEPINPYNEDASEVYPEGTVVLSPSVTALGHITFKDNNDGTVTFYDVPSHFQDHRWTEDGYSKQETARILKNGQTKKIKNALDSDIEKVASYITSDTPRQPEHYDSSNSDDSSSEDSDSSSSDETVTRDNVIDKVEEYEGHTLDTDTYTYKEPEKNSDGDWGFSFTDKDGELAGSYIVTSDGSVTKYDENCEEE